MSTLSWKLGKSYGFRVRKLKTISRRKNFIGKIITSERKKFAVKSLVGDQKKQPFIVKTEQLLDEKGVDLARPIPTEKNQLAFRHKGKMYVVYEWIEGKGHRLNDRRDLKSAVKTLAKFHRASFGLVYPSKIKKYSHPSWILDYKQRLNTIKKWEKKHIKTKSPKLRLILSYIPFFLKMGKISLNKLKRSPYRKITSQPYTKQSLVHGDFHQNNIMVQGHRKVLFDFEDVRYDLPSKDLLRIFSMYTRHHKFKSKDFLSMLKEYEKKHPLSLMVRKVLLIDFQFPHIFERNLRQKKYVQMPYAKAKHQIEQEKKKIKFIYKYYFNNK